MGIEGAGSAGPGRRIRVADIAKWTERTRKVRACEKVVALYTVLEIRLYKQGQSHSAHFESSRAMLGCTKTKFA